MKKKFVVDIIMTTYNQERYIAKAIESVLMQKLDVPFRLIIGEDCSTDKTYLICKEYAIKYPKIIKLLDNKQNLGLLKNYKRCFEESKAKYIAILEGDDYWTDCEKLKKQIEILEMDNKIGLVHSNYTIFDENTEIFKPTPPKIIKKCLTNQGYIYNSLIRNNFICAMTVIFRRELITNTDFYHSIRNDYLTIDYHIWLLCSIQSKIYYFKDTMGVYRISSDSISNNLDFQKRESFSNTKRKIVDYFLRNYPINNYTISDLNNELNMELLLRAMKTANIKYIKKYWKLFSFKGIYHVLLRSFDYIY